MDGFGFGILWISLDGFVLLELWQKKQHATIDVRSPFSWSTTPWEPLFLARCQKA